MSGQSNPVSADQFGALTLLHIALKRGTRITLFFSSGFGLTLEGAQGQTHAMARILQLCNAKEFIEGDKLLICHVIFPQPLIPILEKSNPAKTPAYNIPKYDLEAAIAARLLCLNSGSANKKLGTFISSTESVGIDENLTCSDSIRQAFSISFQTRSIIQKLVKAKNNFQIWLLKMSAHIISLDTVGFMRNVIFCIAKRNVRIHLVTL